MIVVSRYGDELVVNTKGSLEPTEGFPMIRLARDLLRERLGEEYPKAFAEGFTYLYELIHPESRAASDNVLDYGDEREMYHLETIYTESGEQDWPQAVHGPLTAEGVPAFPEAPVYPDLTDIDALPEREDKEGYVIRFASGQRFKVKHAEYLRTMRLVVYLTPKHIWEALRDGKTVGDIAEKMPDELYAQAEEMAHGIQEAYDAEEMKAREVLDAMREDIGPGAPRKDQAEWIKANGRGLQAVLFPMLDGKSPKKALWNRVRPKEGGKA